MLYEVCIAWNPSYGLRLWEDAPSVCGQRTHSHRGEAMKEWQWKVSGGKSRVDGEEEGSRWEQGCIPGAAITGQGSLILPCNLAGGRSMSCASRPEFPNDGPLHTVVGNGLTFLTLSKSPELSNVGSATNWSCWAQLCQGALQKRISWSNC